MMNLYSATPAMTRGLGFCDSSEGPPLFSHPLRQVRDTEDLFSPGSLRVHIFRVGKHRQCEKVKFNNEYLDFEI